MSEKRILFVCTGNSCRSVMAQRYLEHTLQQAGVESVQVGSAGVFAIEGMSPTSETARVLEAVGVGCSDHRARVLTEPMVQDADVVFVMEEFHRQELARRYPDIAGKVFLLKSYGLPEGPGDGEANIADPIGKPLEVYEQCFSIIREAVGRVARALGVRSDNPEGGDT